MTEASTVEILTTGLPTDILSFGDPTCSSKYRVSLISKHYIVIVLGQGRYILNFEVPSRIGKFISLYPHRLDKLS